MKASSIRCLSVISLLSGLLGGCASNHSGPAAGAPATPKKGHWVAIPPETGSHIPRWVWVDDTGQIDASPSANNVQNGSAADLERVQRNSTGSRPPGR